jgi:hypothetical protein
MTMCRGARTPSSVPAEINHVVITGTLTADPQEARGPTSHPVNLLQLEFPVPDPDDDRVLWKWASCLVEVPCGRSERDIETLRCGAPVLVSGQLSNRWMIEGGHSSQRGVVLASLVKSGCLPEEGER